MPTSQDSGPHADQHPLGARVRNRYRQIRCPHHCKGDGGISKFIAGADVATNVLTGSSPQRPRRVNCCSAPSLSTAAVAHRHRHLIVEFDVDPGGGAAKRCNPEI